MGLKIMRLMIKSEGLASLLRLPGSMLTFSTGGYRTLITLHLTFVRVSRYCNSHGGLTVPRLGQLSSCGQGGGSTLISITATSPVGGATLPERKPRPACVMLSGVSLRGCCRINSYGTSTFFVCFMQLG